MIWIRREGELVRNGLNICVDARFGYVRWRSRERGGPYCSVHRIAEAVEE